MRTRKGEPVSAGMMIDDPKPQKETDMALVHEPHPLFENMLTKFINDQRAADMAAIDATTKDSGQLVKGVVVKAVPRSGFSIYPVPPTPASKSKWTMKIIGLEEDRRFGRKVCNQTQTDIEKAREPIVQLNQEKHLLDLENFVLKQELAIAREAAYLRAVSLSIYKAALELATTPVQAPVEVDPIHNALSFGGLQRGGLRCDQV